MRNPDRIDNFCKELAKIWKNNACDWRFGQLIINFETWVRIYKGIGDIFYIEEDVMMQHINEFVKHMKGKYEND